MKFVNHELDVSRDELITLLSNSELVNKGISFPKLRGIPYMHLKEKENSLRITCEIRGGAVKDNAFITGTAFYGAIKEKDGKTTLRGIISTAPIFHAFLTLMFIVFTVMSIYSGNFSPIPIILIIFDLSMYKDEFKKQGIIERYIARAAKKLRDKE